MALSSHFIITTTLLITMITGKEQKNPCTRNQCLNGGHCTPIDNFSSACICPSTFHGDLCQFRNFCAYSPCKNRGSCEPFEDSGVCSCLFGFEGTYCERKAEDVLLSEKNYDGGRDNADEDVKSAGLFTFMKTVKKSSWRDKVAFDPCYVPEGGGLIRCLNGGKCIPLVRRVGIVPGEGNQYECECTGKFTGPYCEFENACFSSPCKNGGSCQSFEDSGVCRCPVGFGGSFCEEIETGHKPSRIKKLTTEPVLKPPSKDDICYRYTKTRSHPCSHHGECISLNATHFECLCTEKYSGDSCQYRNPCYTFECLNGGTCEVKYDASGICNCAPGFMGTYCEEKLFKDEPEEIDVVTEKSSATRLCLNGGTFAHLKGSPSSSSSSYECICPSNFTGRWCEFLNACGSSPCLNGGSCEPMEDSGICTCPIGFKGTFCGEIDDTRKTRVERLGRTFPLVRKQIKEGIRISDDKEVWFQGGKEIRNLKKIDHCDNSETNSEKPVCLNGGRCVILDEEMYGCDCPIAFSGSVCQFEDVCASAPCINGGTCESLGSSGVCSCPPEWTGQFCEDELLPEVKQKISGSKSSKLLEQGVQGSGYALLVEGQDENNLEPPYSMLGHLYKSKLPKNPASSEFLSLKPKEYYQDHELEERRQVIRIPGFEDINSSMIRIASDGTVYVRQPRRKKDSKTKVDQSKSSILIDLKDQSTNKNNHSLDHIVDASIVKVMPNGELFIKMKIPKKSHGENLLHNM